MNVESWAILRILFQMGKKTSNCNYKEKGPLIGHN